MPYFQIQLGYEERYLPRTQKEKGNEVCVITSDRYFPFADFKRTVGHILGSRKVNAGLFREDGIVVYRLPCLFEWGTGILVNGVKKALEHFAPDVVHAHGLIQPMTILSALNKRSIGYKLVVDEHMILDDFPRATLKHLAYATYKKLAFLTSCKKVDMFIAITPAVHRWLQEEFNIDSQLIALVPLGADADLFKRAEQDRVMVRANLLHLDDDEVLVIYAGKLQPDKDIDILMKGIAPLMKKCRVKLLLLGNGPKKYISEILSFAKRNNMEKGLILHEFVPHKELAKFYSASDIGVWPGKPSITIIEAMSSGLPIVVADSEQTYHLLAYHNGFSFAKRDSRQLKTCLERLIEDKKLRHAQGLSSRKLVEERLSWDRIAEKTLETYENILAG